MTRLRVPVLMFHHVEPAPAAELVPPPLHPNSYLARRELAGILDILAGSGYRTLTLGAAAAACHADRHLPRRTVVLTFDDGCRCFRDHALPELVARGMTATLFAVSGELGGSNRWDRPADGASPSTHGVPGATGTPDAAGERREDLLDAAALRALTAAGIEVGSHSRSHRDLTACDAAALAAEVAGSREELAAAIGAPVATFCYPYGRLDERVRAAAAAAGYSAAAAIHGVSAARRGDFFALPRLAINPGESRFELLLKASGAYPWWSRLPRLGLLRALRQGAPPPPAALAAAPGAFGVPGAPGGARPASEAGGAAATGEAEGAGRADGSDGVAGAGRAVVTSGAAGPGGGGR
ncbi:MAG TPA: polysaccharide deacetylase family protein [Thermoanaerobaculia bacterium]|nr:polysaccharide deacetylase family protein [Thermoanaerobaculia bacterium]